GDDGVRLLRLRNLRGDFAESAALARDVGASEDSARLEAALALLAHGDDQAAWAVAEPVLARANVPRWGELVGRTSITLASEASALARIEQACAAQKSDITLLCDLAIWLAARSNWNAAGIVCAAIAERWPTDPNNPWTAVRCSLYAGRAGQDA